MRPSEQKLKGQALQLAHHTAQLQIGSHFHTAPRRTQQ